MRKKISHRSTLVLLVLLAVSTLAAPAAFAQTSLENPLVFIKYRLPNSMRGVVRGNLFRLDPDGSTHNLTRRNNVAVRDPEVSYDGTRVVFAMRVGSDLARWQVYEVGVDGSGLRKVSKGASHNDMDPAYMPDGRIVFTTDRLRWSDGYENVPTTQVAVMNADGSDVRVLKVNTAGHSNPLVSSDGMLYFTQWDFHDRRKSMADEEDEDFDVNRFLLWKIFADGSGQDHPHFGAHTIGDFTPGYVEIRERPSAPGTFVATFGSEDTQEISTFHPDRLVFVPGTFLTFLGASLVSMEPQANQNRDEVVYLTTEGGGEDEEEETQPAWRSPLPLADGRLVASYSPGGLEERNGPQPWELWIMNGDGSGKQPLYKQPGQWCTQAVEVVARTAPQLQAGFMKPEYPYAVINALDVTLREDDSQAKPALGQVTQVRVYREDARTTNTHDLQVDEDSTTTATGAFKAWKDADTQLLGTAPVAGDDSFAIVVPADTPLTWELLDAAGNVVVRERFGTELRAGEVRTCTGCHAPHNGRQGATTNFALDSPTNLSGQDVDLDKNGIVDLFEGLCESQPSFCTTGGGGGGGEAVPKAPSNLQGSALSVGDVRLTWKDNSDNETRFLVFRKVAGTTPFQLVGIVSADKRQFRDRETERGTTYIYTVRSKNAVGPSPLSNRVRIMTRK